MSSPGDALAQLQAKDKRIAELEAEVERLNAYLRAHDNLCNLKRIEGGGRESGPAGSSVETRETVQIRTAAEPAAPLLEPYDSEHPTWKEYLKEKAARKERDG